jgi:hypothetical protein
MGTLSIINAAVFDGVSGGLADGPVHVADDRIVSVGGPAQPAGQVIDARGGTVLPGLIDAHCHAYGISLDMMATESQPLSYVALAVARRPGLGWCRYIPARHGRPGFRPWRRMRSQRVVLSRSVPGWGWPPATTGPASNSPARTG